MRTMFLGALMPKRKPRANALLAPHQNEELPYDHFGAELFCTYYAASVREKPLREFSTDEWLDLARLLYTLWQQGTGYEKALAEIGDHAKLARRKQKRRARKSA